MLIKCNASRLTGLLEYPKMRETKEVIHIEFAHSFQTIFNRIFQEKRNIHKAAVAHKL